MEKWNDVLDINETVQRLGLQNVINFRPPMKKLPPTDANLQLHVLRGYLQMLLWKAIDQHDPPEEARNIANCGWCIEGFVITPAVSTVQIAP